jgi:hypothetical protein
VTTSVSMCIWSAQAQSKRCFPLSTKTQNNTEQMCILAPIFRYFWYLFHAFSPKCPKGSRATPQSAKSKPKWSPRVPKWSPRVVKWKPRGTPKCQKNTKVYPKCAKLEAQGATQTHKHTNTQTHKHANTQTTQTNTYTHKLRTSNPKSRGRVLAAGDVDPAAGRGTTLKGCRERASLEL